MLGGVEDAVVVVPVVVKAAEIGVAVKGIVNVRLKVAAAEIFRICR